MHLNQMQVQMQMRMNQMQMQVQMQPSQGNQMQVHLSTSLVLEAGRSVAHSFRQTRSKVSLKFNIILILGAMNNTVHNIQSCFES